MKESKIRTLYKDLLKDIDFDRLELGLKTPNIFEVLSVTKTEIRHSNFLGWLLDSNGNHSIGNHFISKFLRGISTYETSTSFDELDIENLNFNNVEIRREWRNVDLLIIFDTLVVCIENKIDSKDHSDQLKRYRKIVTDSFPHKKKLFVYLTPTGEEPSDKEELLHYALYSYQEIIEQLDRILEIYGNSLNPSVFHYISDYVTTLKRQMMKNDELNILADKIYKNHKEILDFVYENRTDMASMLYSLFADKIEKNGWILGSKHKGFVRFTTPELFKIIPNKGTGWPNNENFLFEIDFHWYEGKAVFKTVVSPSESEVHKVLDDIMRTVEGHKKPRGKKWLVHFLRLWKFNPDDFLGVELDESDRILEDNWAEITAIVNKVETAFIKRKEEILKYKS